MTHGTVILGGGLGALRTAQALRHEGFEGTVTVLSGEGVLPYDRPPLSKAFLLGTIEDVAVFLTDAKQLNELGIVVRLDARAETLDLGARRVGLATGAQVPYDDLVVATGARPTRLDLLEGIGGVVYLRDLQDARTLRRELAAAPRLGIVGGGFIGLEIASAARALGCETTVIEAAEAPLAPILGAELGSWVQAWHEEQGVRFVCGAPLASVDGRSRPERLTTAAGRVVNVDCVVVGVGIRPELRWLDAAGLKTHRGLVCNAAGRTSNPHVYGVGDVTCRHDAANCSPSGHWTATNEHARAAAASVLGRAPAGQPVQPGYFWSDQFDRRLQFAGSVSPSPRITVSSGVVRERRFVALLEDAEALTGVFAMSSPREFVRSSLSLRR